MGRAGAENLGRGQQLHVDFQPADGLVLLPAAMVVSGVVAIFSNYSEGKDSLLLTVPAQLGIGVLS